MPLSDIVNVTISRQTAVVSRTGFGTLLIVGPNLKQTPSAKRFYIASTLAEVAAELTGGTADEEYAAAVTLFSQDPRPPRVIIGYEAIGDADMAASLAAIQVENDDWYGVMIIDRTLAQQLSAATWVQTQTKIFGVADDDPNMLLPGDVTSLSYQLQQADRWRTFCQFNGLADGVVPGDPFAEAATFGEWMPRDPGSYTVMFKTLSGIAVDAFTTSQSDAVLAKNANIFQLVGGNNIYREGTVSESSAAGEYIDIVVFIDWLQSRMTEDVFSALVNLPKVPFTDPGISVIETQVKGRLEKGVDAGGLAANPPFTVTVPLAADVDPADKANRLLPDVTFTGTLAGAIHAVEIAGTVTL